MARVVNGGLRQLLREQSGVITTAQARAAGVTESAIRAHLTRGRWQRLRHGVYAAFSGPVPRACHLWAVVLAAGPGAVLSHETAAELAGLIDRSAKDIHVSIPAERKVAPMPGVVVHKSRRVTRANHPALQPPQTRIEETVIDLTQTARTVRDAYGWLARGVNSRLTTPGRLLEAMAQRPRLRWHRLLREGLGDLAAGCHSVLELAYLRDVERAHGLPVGDRQSPDRGGTGRIYLDVRYRCFATRVELDGLAAHPADTRHRDMARDNDAVESGDRPLRYGTPDVHERPCAVARQVAAVLRRGGWTGPPRQCGRLDCLLP